MTKSEKKATKIVYHVFTHNTDDWCDTLEEARALFDEYVRDYDSARLYEEERDGEMEIINENCIASHGGYPM